MSDEATRVVLSADVSQYEQSLTSAEQTTNNLAASMEKLATTTEQAFKRTGRNMQIGGAGITASLTALGVAAGRVDSQMAQLQGSTELIAKSQAEGQRRMKDYKQAVTDLRSTFGMTSSEAIGLVTELNKLGRNSGDVNKLAQSYTRLGAVVGESTSVLTQEMVTLNRQMGVDSVKGAEVLNTTLAQLSQSAGVSATSVAQFSNAIAPVGRVAGMTTKEIMGVSTSFVKAGADGFAASTAFNRMLTDITRSIQYGSPELAAYANLIGVSMDTFKKMDRTEAVVQVFEQINKQGPEAIKTLNRLGLDGVRTYKSLQAVASDGGLRAAITSAVDGGNPEDLKKAGDTTFQGLNDELRKTGEMTKIIGESFGEGVLPVLEKAARLINGLLRPLNEFLQAMGKVPGGTALLAGLGTVVAGTAVKHAIGVGTIGMAAGPLSTMARGWRGARRAEADLSLADRTAQKEHQKWLAGTDAKGSALQHRFYQLGGWLGGRAPVNDLDPAVMARRAADEKAWAAENRRLIQAGEQPLTRKQAGIHETRSQRWSRRTAGLINFAGDAARQPYDSLGFRTQGIPFLGGGNVFDRDQALMILRDPSLQKSLKLDKLRAAGSGFADLLRGRGDGDSKMADRIDKMTTAFGAATTSAVRHAAATNADTGARNLSTKTTTTYTTATGALVKETIKFNAALIQATASVIRGGAIAGGHLVAGAVRKGAPAAMNALTAFAGGPVGIAMIGGGLAYGLYGKRQDDWSRYAAAMGDATNKSPAATYAAALGEASAATKSFAEAVKANASEINKNKEFDPSTGQDEAEKIRKEKEKDEQKYTFEGMKGASQSEAQMFADMVFMGGGSNAQKELLRADLLQRFGYGGIGRKITEDILTSAGETKDLDFDPMFENISNKQGRFDIWGADDSMISAAGAMSGSFQEMLVGMDLSEASQASIALMNQAFKDRKDAGWNGRNMYQNEGVALGVVQSLLGTDVEEDDVKREIQIVKHAMQQRTAEEMHQFLLADEDTQIGEAWRAATSNIKDIRNPWEIMDIPNMALKEVDPWEKAGIDKSVLTLLRGENTYYDGKLDRVSRVDNVSTSIFRNQPRETIVGKAVETALLNESDENAQWSAMKELANSSLKLNGSFSEAVYSLDRIKSASFDTSSALYGLTSAAQNYVRQQQSEAMRFMSPAERVSQIKGNYEAAKRSYAMDPNAESGRNMEEARVAYQNEIANQRDYMTGIATQKREYDVSVSRSNEDFARQQAHMQFDFDLSRQRAYEDFNRQRERSEYDFNLQREHATQDYARSLKHAHADFNRQRQRSEEDYNHQVKIMTEQTARQMVNMYERINVQRTWSANNLLQNMQDQEQRLAEQQTNLQRLRDAGLSGDAIKMMGLNEVGNHQQLARLTDDVLNNPEMIAQFNRAVQNRTDAAEKIVKDKDSQQWQEMQRSFNLNLDRGQEDFNISLSRQAEQFGIGFERQRIAFDRQMGLGQEDFNRMMARQEEDFKRQHDRMIEQYGIAMARAAEDFSRQHEIITLGFEELAELTLETLTGSALAQQIELLKNLGYTRGEIMEMTTGLVKDLKELWRELGIGQVMDPKSGNLIGYSALGPGAGANPQRGQFVSFAEGGEIPGQSPHPKADNIPIWATAGEFMQPVDAVNYYGKGFHEAVRKKQFPKEFAEGYATGGLIAYGRRIQDDGFHVSEHPAFGGVRGRHAPTSQGGLHYIGHAIDVNADHMRGGEMLNIDRLVASRLARMYGLRTTWRYPGHYDHAHMDTRRGPDRGNFTGATVSGVFPLEQEIEERVKKLKGVKAFDDLFTNNYVAPFRAYGGGWLADLLVKGIMSAIDPYDTDYDGSLPKSTIQALAKSKAADRGWTGSMWQAIDWIVQRESSWNPNAQNPTSTAFGLFQFLDQTWTGVGGRKTADPSKQIDYGLKYIAQRYGNPLKAKAFWEKNNWYGDGAMFTEPTTIGVGERGPEAVIPLNSRGVDFLSDLMKRNAADSLQAMVHANGVPQRVNTSNYYQQIDKGTHIHGPITVQANDPNEFIRKMEAKKRDEAMKGRVPR